MRSATSFSQKLGPAYSASGERGSTATGDYPSTDEVPVRLEYELGQENLPGSAGK